MSAVFWLKLALDCLTLPEKNTSKTPALAELQP